MDQNSSSATASFSSAGHRRFWCTQILLALGVSWHFAQCHVLLEAPESDISALIARNSHSSTASNVSRLSMQELKPAEWMKQPIFHSPKVFAADYAEMKQTLKLFIYPHPQSSNEDESRFFGSPGTESLPKGNYASDEYFFRNLYETELVTRNPNEALFFVLPFSVYNLRKAIGASNVPAWVAEYMEGTVTRKWAYWNRSSGVDHFYATCHDVGVDGAAEVPTVRQNAVQITCGGNLGYENFIPTKDFSYPQIWPRYTEAEPGGLSAAERKASKVLAFWSGTQMRHVRPVLKTYWENDDEILLGGGRVLKMLQRGSDYVFHFKIAKYCLHASGHRVNTCRIGDAIYFGCVPVIISDQFDLPFLDVLDWRELAVIIVESQIPDLKTILKSIPDERYEQLHANVHTIRHLFIWNSPPQDYDVFHMMLYELWIRRFFTRPPLESRIALA